MFKITTQLLLPKLSLVKLSSKPYSTCEDDETKNSAFGGVKPAAPIEIFHLLKRFNADTDEKKVNLGIGAYRTNDSKPYLLPVVLKCEKDIVSDYMHGHEYLPILGDPEFTRLARELLLGRCCMAVEKERVLAVQTLSGTGALRLGAEFLAQKMQRRIALVSNPTWGNHVNIFRSAGFRKIKTYTYWHAKKRKIDFPKLLSDLAEAPEGAVVILHASAHNPTGMDPTRKQWKQIAEVIKCRKLFPFFDAAYIGFASGDPDRDAWAIRYFEEQGFEFMAAQSFSKNMGLYGERVGALVLVLKHKKLIAPVTSQLTFLVRVNYSNPPSHGARIVKRVLGDLENTREWKRTIKKMTNRVKNMRKALREKLEEMKTPGKWKHITKQIGMFSYTGLKPYQVKALIEEKHIYLPKSGRINCCALTTKNVDYVAKSFDEVIRADKE